MARVGNKLREGFRRISLQLTSAGAGVLALLPSAVAGAPADSDVGAPPPTVDVTNRQHQIQGKKLVITMPTGGQVFLASHRSHSSHSSHASHASHASHYSSSSGHAPAPPPPPAPVYHPPASSHRSPSPGTTAPTTSTEPSIEVHPMATAITVTSIDTDKHTFTGKDKNDVSWTFPYTTETKVHRLTPQDETLPLSLLTSRNGGTLPFVSDEKIVVEWVTEEGKRRIVKITLME